MKMRRYIGALCAALLTAACADDADLLPSAPEEEEPLPAGVVEVPVTLTLGADWELYSPQTKDVPPGMETTIDVDGHAETDEINTVRVITFRRRSLDDIIVTEETDTSFIYDPSNDLTLACNWESSSLTDHTHQHKVARGTLKKTYGYEYRVVALAYGSGQEGWFTLNLADGLRFADFKATVNIDDGWDDYLTGNGYVLESNNRGCLTEKVVFVPQFFFGYCHTGNDNPIIPFAEDGTEVDKNGDPVQVTDKPLSGLLYRGVAKLELEFFADAITVANDKVPLWCGLLATNVKTTVGLTDYDDFLSPGGAVPVPSAGKEYTMIYQALDLQKDQLFKLTAYVLPAKMKLGIRVKTDASSDINKMRNGQVKVTSSSSSSSAENATGIISTDVEGDELFYFRRNHKYVFTNGWCSGTIANHEMD